MTKQCFALHFRLRKRNSHRSHRKNKHRSTFIYLFVLAHRNVVSTSILRNICLVLQRSDGALKRVGATGRNRWNNLEIVKRPLLLPVMCALYASQADVEVRVHLTNLSATLLSKPGRKKKLKTRTLHLTAPQSSCVTECANYHRKDIQYFNQCVVSPLTLALRQPPNMWLAPPSAQISINI